MEYEAACYNLYSKKPYNKLEEVLKYISTNFVTVDDESIMTVNPLLRRVLNTIIPAMRSVSSLFDEIFETLAYVGSFYDGVKVGQPNEFDIDLLLHLPKILNAQIIPTTQQPGFVFVQLQDWDRFKKDKYLYSRCKDLESLKDSYNYLIQEKVLRWIQQTVAKALNKIYNEGLLPGISISYSMSGPAVTLHILYNSLDIDVDLVAVFRMPVAKWPKHPFRPCPTSNYLPNDFYVVPKAPKSDEIFRPRCWRLSFQIHEQRIINGRYFFKPALKLLKKLRDTRNHNIPSYFIKTIFLWRAEMEMQDPYFWNTSLNFVFMEMLKFYQLTLASESIRYYWNPENNLLQNTNPETIENIRNFLERMINTIHKNIHNDPYIIAKFLLPEHEYIQLIHHFNGTEYECIKNESQLYANFKEQDNQADSGSTFLRILTCVAIGAAVLFFRGSQ